MNAGNDLLTPVGGVAGLICRGFTMRQIARLYRLRRRCQSTRRQSGAGGTRRDTMSSGSLRPNRRFRTRLDGQRWPRF
jgi:hypothetical protein